MDQHLSYDNNIPSHKSALGRQLRILVLMVGDLVCLQIAIHLALFTRFNGVTLSRYYDTYLSLAPWYILGALSIFAWRGLYRSLWRYAGLEELYNILITTATSTALLLGFGFIYPLPRMALAMQFFILTVIVAFWRLSLRALRRALIARSRTNTELAVHPNRHNVLIVGARGPGADLVAPLQMSGRNVIGFADDDPEKRGMKIHGVRVLGTLAEVARIVSLHDIQEVLFALPLELSHRQGELVEALAGMNVTLRTIPTVNELIDGKVSVSRIRPILIDDLLGREPVKLNLQKIAESIRGEVVLVTGAGGSIGSELCRQVCRFEPSLLIMLGHGENSIFEAALDMNQRFPQVSKAQVIADVRDRAKVDMVFAQYRPTLVFHAAADKHVHFMEEFPEEAVKTNIFGTQNVAQAALRYGVKKFVMISTDKAVNPTSVMGCTKRVAEMVVQDLNDAGGTRFVSVRFGNVLGSRGSVVPVFQKQIAAGGPVTVTDPEMRRYFMTIPEAVQLVLQAESMGQGGEVFVLDMGQPVKIVDLARNLISLSGFKPGKDIQIHFTGRRPGEKLFEELLLAEEGTDVTEHSRIFMSKNARLANEELKRKLLCLETSTFKGEADRIVNLLQELVPNYQPYRPVVESEVAVTGEFNMDALLQQNKMHLLEPS